MTISDDAAVQFSGVTLRRGARTILSDISFRLPRGSVTAVLGPSGAGKSTLLYGVVGELVQASGDIDVLGHALPRPRVRDLFTLRRQMGVMLQGNGLLSDLDVFENVALPLRTHTDLPEELIRELVQMKLAAVGLGEAGALETNELSGGMARRVALARAVVSDPPLMLYDEPLTGLDPIACGVIVNLIRRLNDALGMTSLVITHNVREVLEIADQVLIVANRGIVFAGTPAELDGSADPLVRQFMDGGPDGPIGFDYRATKAVAHA
ncbi:ATP-binding cassette domain-containing protein [Denitratimonas sp. CY0512]|uniref:ABC transporter ATP-binding protein n=1 Tax=Denitratimonas sp. CY0512 TaxID=3131940 RepID=UPI0030B276ED